MSILIFNGLNRVSPTEAKTEVERGIKKWLHMSNKQSKIILWDFWLKNKIQKIKIFSDFSSYQNFNFWRWRIVDESLYLLENRELTTNFFEHLILQIACPHGEALECGQFWFFELMSHFWNFITLLQWNSCREKLN